MAQMLARMERDGLIQRAADPADGRSSRITLTELAEERLPDAVAALLRVIVKSCATSQMRRPGCWLPCLRA